MKKYLMFLLTLAVLIAAVITQISAYTALPKPNLREPFLKFTSPKFGQIKTMVWLNNFILADNAVLVLATHLKDNRRYSNLFYLDVTNGKSTLLAEFPTHPYLDNVILFSNNSIITAYNEGIVKTRLTRDDKQNLHADQELIPINGFNEANSMDFKGNLYYSKVNDHLLYVKNFEQLTFPFFNTDNQPNQDLTFLRKPYQIVNANTLDRTLTYTSLTGNGIDLYSMDFTGLPLTFNNAPLISKVVQAQAIEDGYGFIGMKFSDDPSKTSADQTLDIFMVRRNTSDDPNLLKLDTIPFNTDPLGALPAMSSTTFNEDYTLAYTSYDESHRGKLIICNYEQKPKVILENENLFGPISIARKNIPNPTGPSVKDGSRSNYILYFTLDKDRVRVKICDEQGKFVKDLTNMLMGNVD
ncbi:hypothetical protein Desaci_0346 [Desulfosporosinus acidiphilus SJ4]|uniref:Uncharacterized protein n=1 Tax=Desulfosporosinus acidiphilus (strain DSM 22704 / JCM 16185 / SJ4) TaxID=646529 RepID=I4D0U2_DESAJ|nr:hypothetical protein [Desulfosporosinus acidiphilus]AFM39416.1 hypothetical protein Desaci_0346 [Desulfosporosinus acidiphilus SJ4]